MSRHGVYDSESEPDQDPEDLEVEVVGEKSTKIDNFVGVISKYKILFEKSQVPHIMVKKEKAILDCLQELEKSFGESYNKKTLSKKISRIKNDVKVKSDKNRTGNKKVILKNWEKVILEIIGENENPTILKIPGAVAVGSSSSSTTDISSAQDSNVSTSPQNVMIPPRPKAQKRKISPIEDHETEETKNLSNSELQRLVLLEQLSYYRLKKAKLD